MDTLQAFIQWYHRMGGKYNESYNEQIKSKLMETKVKNSSFKERAEEVKRKYNHKFWKNVLKNVPDISKLKFEKK